MSWLTTWVAAFSTTRSMGERVLRAGADLALAGLGAEACSFADSAAFCASAAFSIFCVSNS
jgi:hypothetical protein